MALWAKSHPKSIKLNLVQNTSITGTNCKARASPGQIKAVIVLKDMPNHTGLLITCLY